MVSLRCETICFCLLLKMVVINCLHLAVGQGVKVTTAYCEERFGLFIQKDVAFNDNKALKWVTES